jgi:hypothetical protein
VTQLRDLLPGDLVRTGGEAAVFIASAPHWKYEGLMLACWRLQDGMISFDALAPYQEVGDADMPAPGDRARRLEAAVRGVFAE